MIQINYLSLNKCFIFANKNILIIYLNFVYFLCIAVVITDFNFKIIHKLQQKCDSSHNELNVGLKQSEK